MVKTSGSKGMQMTAPVVVDDPAATSRYAKAMRNIGMNARMIAIGAWAPTAATTKPSVAASE